MVRALVLGLFAIAVVGCGSKEQPPAAQAGVAAGKVIEVSGTVTVRGKALAAGDPVAGDDVIDTGADGHAVIELAHNGARWQLGPNKHEKVTDSLAWTAPKRTGDTKIVEQDTAAAGRPAERSAADTSATAPEAPAPALERADTAPAPAPAPAPSKAAAVHAAPPAPPPPPPPAPPSLEPATGAVGGAAPPPAVTAAPAPPPPPKPSRAKAEAGDHEVSPPIAAAFALLAPHRTELVSCMGGEAAFTLHVAADGSAIATPNKPATDAARACLARIVGAIKFAPGKVDATVDFK